MKKFSVILLLALILSLHGLAQKSSIEGFVKSTEGPLPFASIQVQSDYQVKGASTDENGFFSLRDLIEGTYTLKISSIGYRPFTELISIQAGENIQKEITMEFDRLNLDQVVVSATRNDLDRKEAPVVVGLIQPKLFSATQSFAVSEVLNYQPGLRIETNCQNCGFTQVRINGLEGSYSQILINSRAVFSPLNSVYGLEQIPTNIIDRVEVVRSGGSALFGSNAIAGTVNIITKDPIENTWEVGSNFSLIDGKSADNAFTFNGSLVGKSLEKGATFYGMHKNREAYDANGDGFTEITALENTTFGTKAFLKTSQWNKLSLDLSVMNEFRRGGDRLELKPHLTDITEELDHTTLIGGVTFDQFTKDYLNKFTAYVSGQTTLRDSYYGGLGGGRTPEDSLLALNAYGQTQDVAMVSGIQYTRYLKGNTLTMGFEHQYNSVQDEITGYNRIVDQTVNNLGVYAQFEWKPIERLKTLLGARFDRSLVDGEYDLADLNRTANYDEGIISPRVTVLYDVNEKLQFRGGYARGFRAPQAFNEDLHISSVGGEPLFVILSDDLEKEVSDAYTASLNWTDNIGKSQVSILLEGFYTDLRNPFTIVSTGSTLPNGSIVEEVRNGEGAYVSGTNFELGISPSKFLTFQLGGTAQIARYKETQILFEPETDNEDAPNVSTDEFLRTPNFYGYFNMYWNPIEPVNIDLTGVYTGSMVVSRVIDDSGLIELNDSPDFYDVNCKLGYTFKLKDHFSLQLSGGVQNVFDSFQDDFDMGPTRDSNYVYGPARPRTFFVGVKLGDFH